MNLSMACEKVASGDKASNANIQGDPPDWALGSGKSSGGVYCWVCDCRHKLQKHSYTISYCPEQGHLKVGRHGILNPTANMRKYLLGKSQAEWPKMTKMCKKAYEVSSGPSVEIDYRRRLKPVALMLCVAGAG